MASQVYWIGNDKNVYTKGAGFNGVRNLGRAGGVSGGNGQEVIRSNGSKMYINRAKFIANPGNPSRSNDTTTYDATSGDTSAQDAATRQSNINFVNAAFDTQMAGLQDKLNVLPYQQRAGELNIQNQFQTSRNKLDTSHAQGTRNLDMSDRSILDSRERGIKSISDQLRQQSMSYNNQLGASGAGDSSAAGLINVALGGQASRNRGDLVRNASGQTVAVANQRADLETSFKQNIADLDNWKTQQLSDLQEKFLNLKNEIAGQMANASIQRQQQLAQYDAAVTQQAIQQLSNIQNMYHQQAADLQAHYQNMFAPKEIQIAPELQQYEVQPIDAGTLANIGQVAPVQGETPDQVQLRKRLDEQQSLV